MVLCCWKASSPTSNAYSKDWHGCRCGDQAGWGRQERAWYWVEDAEMVWRAGFARTELEDRSHFCLAGLEQRFPLLSLLARRLLCILPTYASSELVWSGFGHIIGLTPRSSTLCVLLRLCYCATTTTYSIKFPVSELLVVTLIRCLSNWPQCVYSSSWWERAWWMGGLSASRT